MGESTISGGCSPRGYCHAAEATISTVSTVTWWGLQSFEIENKRVVSLLVHLPEADIHLNHQQDSCLLKYPDTHEDLR